jgi:hypothetical protein
LSNVQIYLLVEKSGNTQNTPAGYRKEEAKNKRGSEK